MENVDFLTIMDAPYPKLAEMAKGMGFQPSMMGKRDLAVRIARDMASRGVQMGGGGILDVSQDGFGFLRIPAYDFLPCSEDIHVPTAIIRRHGLKTGHEVRGIVRPPKEGDKHFSLAEVASVNGGSPQSVLEHAPFESLIPIFPNRRMVLENGREGTSMRVLDLVAPIGRGQRGLIVSPPKAGKTVMLQDIARSIAANSPDSYLIVLLIDERPEEVTDMRRTVKGEVIASTFDEPASRHCQVAEIVMERAKRLVEYGRHVVILLDSITRLGRAYNTETPHSGKVLTGGIDAAAMQKPKRFFGAARNAEGGGSLTIIGTALVDTGSKMDDIIFEEFKGTGNMEVRLDRRLMNRRLFPTIDVGLSGTRKEELLLSKDDLQRTWLLRRYLQDLNLVEAMEFLVEKVKKTASNAEFLAGMKIPS